MTKRFHLSREPELIVKFPVDPSNEIKPKGFWYDVGLDWLRWLDGEQYLNDGYNDWMRNYLYKVEVEERNILTIRNNEQFADFEQRYVTIDLGASLAHWWAKSAVNVSTSTSRCRWFRSFPSG